MVNTAEHVRKLRDKQTEHNQTQLQYGEFLKSLFLIIKYNNFENEYAENSTHFSN